MYPLKFKFLSIVIPKTSTSLQFAFGGAFVKIVNYLSDKGEKGTNNNDNNNRSLKNSLGYLHAD